MKSIVVVLSSLLFCGPAFANCGEENLDPRPFFAQVRTPAVAAEKWVDDHLGLSEELVQGAMSVPQRVDRTFVRHLVKRYAPATWVEEDTTFAAGWSPLGMDLPAFEVDTKLGFLSIVSNGRVIMMWLAAEKGRHETVSADHPFVVEFDKAEVPLVIEDRDLAVPMLATYLATKASSADVTKVIRTELDVRDHYLMKVEGNYLRLKALDEARRR